MKKVGKAGLEPSECFSVPGYRYVCSDSFKLRKKDPLGTQTKGRPQEPQPNFNNSLFKIIPLITKRLFT